MSFVAIKPVFLRRGFSLSLFLSLISTTALAFDFSAPLQNVQVSVSGVGNSTVVSYSVTDPVYGPRQGSVSSPGSFVSTPTTAGGVVAWVASSPSGSTVYYRIYDPGRSNWMAGVSGVAAASIIGPLSDSGLIAWQSGTVVFFTAYDPVAGAWNTAFFQPPGAFSLNSLNNNGGVIAFLSDPGLGDQTVWYLTYNPYIAGTSQKWVLGSLTTPGFISGISVDSGVVAWAAGNTISASTYDFGRAAWRPTSGPVGSVVSNPQIANSTVTFTAGTPAQVFLLGYNSVSGAWIASSTPAFATFFPSPSSGPPPLFVWYNDLSLGGTSWAWNFGDGATTTGRTPYHIFNGFGRFPVTETVFGTTGSSMGTTNIVTDLAAPTGTLKINNDDSYTRSANVTLTLNVTDNSGIISSMRFSNTNNTNWSAWMPYATSASWVLSSGDGLKGVYGQFSDPASNILTVSDNITLDSRPPPVAFVTNYFVSESTTSLLVTVQLSNSTPFKASVDYATSDGTATGGIDYGITSGRIIFQPFETNHTFTLYITNDTQVELNETLFIELSNPTNVTLGPPATITILDNDLPTVSFATNTFYADEGQGQALITASLNVPSGLSVSINYASSNGTATAGSDYNSVSGTLNFSPGQMSRTFFVPIIDDTIDEPDETVFLYLSRPTNAVLGAQSTATLVIVDNDPPPASFTTNNYSVSEAAGSVTIPVRLNTPFSQSVFVGYATSDGTAKAGMDYVAANGTVVFAPGETNKSFVITILDDSVVEPNETVLLSLTSLNNATAGLYTSATLTILDTSNSPRLGPSSWQTNRFRSALTGPVGHSYAIEAADAITNTPVWTEIVRVTNTTGTVNFSDPSASGKKRFYRARQTN